MSWQERIENIEFVITTGDGQVFKPLWKGGEKETEFNASEWDFIDVAGTLVRRKQPKSGKFTLVFWFSGENNIEQSEAFEQSSKDPRAWTVQHPFYGNITGQPIKLTRNDNNYNSTEVTVDFWETISTELPKRESSVLDVVSTKTTEQNEVCAASYSSSVDVSFSDQSTIRANASKSASRIDKFITNENYSEFQNLKSQAFSSIDNMLTQSSAAITSISDMIQYGTTLEQSINMRMTILRNMFEDLKELIGLGGTSNKKYFEVIGSAVIAGVANTLLNPSENDYISRNDIENASEELDSIYGEYLEILDNNQTTGVTDTFTPAYQVQTGISVIVSTTISNLFDMAFSARQERIVQVEKDTNLIILVHKYLGLDATDSNIETFRKINGIKNKALFKVKQGRQIKYLV